MANKSDTPYCLRHLNVKIAVQKHPLLFTYLHKTYDRNLFNNLDIRILNSNAAEEQRVENSWRAQH